MNFCPNCGSKLARPDDQFCMNCGAKIPVIQPETAADAAPPSAPAAASPAAEGPAFSGVPITPEAPQPAPAPAQPPQPRGEDLLSMIEEVQNQSASPIAPAPAQPDLFAGEPEPGLFAEAPTMPAIDDAAASGAPADLFTQSPAAQSQPDMFSTSVMQTVKPPPQGTASHPDTPERPAAQPRPAPAPPPRQAAPPPAAHPSAPAQEAAQPLFDTPAAQAAQSDFFAEGAAVPPPAQPQPGLFEDAAQDPAPPVAQDPGQPDLFDTAAMLAQEGRDPLFGQSSRQPAPRRAPAPSAQRAVSRGDTHSQTGQRPRATPRPMREPPLSDTQALAEPAKPRRATPPPVVLPEPEVEIKKTSVIGRILTAFAVLIIFLVVCAATILVMLYFRNRPSQAIDDFTTAVASQDVAQLNKLATVTGVSPSEADWLAFCNAFTTTTDQNELKSQLLMMSEGTDDPGYLYPAVTIEGKPFILFIERYHINVQAVSLLAPGAADGTVVRLDETDHTGTLQADGMLYTGLMPGRYQSRVVPPGVMPENVPPEEITIFGVDGPNTLEGEAPKVEITITNCASDDAVLYVNDQPVGERPVGGTVTIPGVQLGSTIRISAINEGVVMEASVVFNDLNTTQLAFADYTSEGQPAPSSESTPPASDAAPSADEINAVLTAFYQSYLECINQQSMDGIQNTTSNANTALEARIKSTNNAANLFQYTGAAVDAESIKTTTSGDLPAVQFNATFQFGYKGRDADGDYTADSNHQSVELVYQDGKWLVNKMTFVSDGDFGNHTIATFE